MTDRSHTGDAFEEALAASLARYAADAGGTGDAYATADAMIEARGKRRFRIGLAAISGVLAATALAGIAIGAFTEPPPRMGPGPTESLGPSSKPTPSMEPTSEALPGVVAPEACGFPDGTTLSYAGRSTTSALDVQEVVGDPLSDDPADIYVTWDKVDWGGWGRVRLVCAIFVDGFVEITVHPDDGGRSTAEPMPTVTRTPLPSGMIEILTHCGLDFVRIEYEGRVWRFDVDDQPNPPEGWGFNTTVVELVPSPTGPIVIGPDGSEWPLIPAEPDSSPGACM